MLKKVICIIVLGAILFSSFSLSAFAMTIDESNGNIDSYYLYNYENSMIMAQKNADSKIPASSAVKMMTAYVALESGVSFDKPITITQDMLEDVSGRFMGLVKGDVMSFEDLLYSMICASFNDATQAIAISVSGSIESYLALMNEKTAELGMNDTFYADITGLSGSSYTTVNDIKILAEALINNAKYIEITSTKTYQLSAVATCEYNKITNRSSLIGSYKGICNFNTGSNLDDEDSAVIYINNGTISLLCIVMNATSAEASSNSAEYYAKKLINHGLYDYSVKVLKKADTPITTLPIKLSISNEEVYIYLKDDLKGYVSDDVDIDEDLQYNYYLFDSELKAPIKNGDQVGVIVASKNGKFLASAPLVVKEDVDQNSLLTIMELMKEYIGSRAFVFTILLFVVLMVLYYYKKKSLLDKMYKTPIKRTLKYYRK